MSDEYNPICDLCFPFVEYVGRISDELVVGKDVIGRIMLFTEPCHNGGDLLRFEAPPTPDPVPADDDEAEAAFDADPDLSSRSSEWLKLARTEFTKMNFGADLRGAWRVVEGLRRVGYDPDEDGDVEVWLYDKIGRMLA
jgi:hypothetical protein